MQTGSFFFITGISILVIAFLFRPFLLEKLKEVTPTRKRAYDLNDVECMHLHEERDRLLKAARDLNFDHQLGKVPDDVYQAQRKDLITQGADILRRIDEINCADRKDLKNEFLKDRRVWDFKPVYDRSDAAEEMIAQHRRKQSERSMGFCPHCGTPYKRSDNFCAHCGNKIQSK